MNNELFVDIHIVQITMTMREKQMRQTVFLLTIITSICIIIYVRTLYVEIPTVKYFPLNNVATFLKSKTNLTVNEQHQEIDWIVYSKSSEPTYLRQDISLLYKNGYYLGVFSAWRQYVSELKQEKTFPITPNSFYESISYHHGEIHEANTITSIQAMSRTHMFVFKENDKVIAFYEPTTDKERQIKATLRRNIDNKLTKHWQKLANELNINLSRYDCIPLTALTQIDKNRTFSRLSPSTQQRVIGQLWEGLYNNYIIPLQEQPEQAHYVPLILLDKQLRELRIIYEFDNKPTQLIQRISSTN